MQLAPLRRGGINDNDSGAAIAYDLSAATSDEIAELRALEKSLGSAALTVVNEPLFAGVGGSGVGGSGGDSGGGGGDDAVYARTHGRGGMRG